MNGVVAPMLKKIGLNVLHYSGSKKLFGSAFAGLGSVLTLHHVCPDSQPSEFAPNSILNVTPEFLAAAILRIREAGFEIISICEFDERMQARTFENPFVVITLDDGYRDNYDYAYPVFLEHRVPFCIYLCTGVLNRTANLWWRDLEMMISESERIKVPAPGGGIVEHRTRTVRQKNHVFEKIYWELRRMPLQQQLDTARELNNLNPTDGDSSQDAPLDSAMIQDMQSSGLLTLGAHTVSHYALSKLSEDEVTQEIEDGRAAIAAMTGVSPEHFAYPFGDRESAAQREFDIVRKLGFRTAVTTKKGVIHERHVNSMHALPRISLNGAYQKRKYLDLFLTGLPFAIHDTLVPAAD